MTAQDPGESMPSPDPQQLIRLALPLLESWMREDPRHHAFLAELARWLTDLTADAARVPNAVPSPTIAPIKSPTPRATKAESPVTVLKAPDSEKLAGGLAPTPAAAAGVSTPMTPPSPSPSSPPPSPKPTIDETTRKKRFLSLQKAQYHREMIAKCVAAKDHAATGSHIASAVAALESHIDCGGSMKPGDEGLELLVSIVESITPKVSLPVAVERTLTRIFESLDAQEELDDGSPAAPNPAAIAQPLLKGRTAVLIGGDVRESRRAALIRDLGLADLRWIRSTPSKPATKFDADVKRSDVDLVLVAIRWVRHGTSDAAGAAATRFGKPLVRLPGGLGSNAVAHEILEQARSRLVR